ncbi:MAG: tetratricopeptide repeat protein [Leptolyngbyaceae cyanobacterium]
MGKRQKVKQNKKHKAGPSPAERIKTQLEKEKYSQAINTFQSLSPDEQVELGFTEASLWLQRGQYECREELFASAEDSIGQALRLERTGEIIYWFTKALVLQGQYTEALALATEAFADKTLDKAYVGCYLRLLFLCDRLDEVKDILKTPAKQRRFYAYHLHWARGMVALLNEEFDAALTHFKKVNPHSGVLGNYQQLWVTYTHQQADRWELAQPALVSPYLARSGPFSGSDLFSTLLSGKQRFPTDPAKQRLAIRQAIATDLPIGDVVNPKQMSPSLAHAAFMLEMVSLIEQNNLSDAAQVYQDLPRSIQEDYPELASLSRPMLLMAGDQAARSGQPDDAIAFWTPIVDRPEFDPQLAWRLSSALQNVEADRENQQLLNRLLKWVQRQAKKTPAEWPEDRLNPVLVKIHCRLFDSYGMSGRDSDRTRTLRSVMKLAPDHPDVMGRQGIEAILNHQSEEGIDLLTKSLEAGCEHPLIYTTLTDSLQEIGRVEQLKEIRRKFGRRFGDINAENDADMPKWLEVLLMKDYYLMADFIGDSVTRDPAVEAISVFFDAAEDEPSTAQKITLNQKHATTVWDKMLQQHSVQVQVEMLQAISIMVHTYARRNKKGMKALQDKYQIKLLDLVAQSPEANIAYGLLLTIRGGSAKPLEMALNECLKRSDAPGNTLAAIQQRAHWFDINANPVLRSRIDELLKQESQNPHLLLAKATTYPERSPEYQQYYDQGFELARRLQDADALQAFREEKWIASHNMTKALFHELESINRFELLINPEGVLERIIRRVVGEDAPPDVIAALLPQLQVMLEAVMGEGGGPFGGGPFGGGPFGGFPDDDEEEDFADDGDFFFFPPPSNSGRKKKKKKWFEL